MGLVVIMSQPKLPASLVIQNNNEALNTQCQGLDAMFHLGREQVSAAFHQMLFWNEQIFKRVQDMALCSQERYNNHMLAGCIGVWPVNKHMFAETSTVRSHDMNIHKAF